MILEFAVPAAAPLLGLSQLAWLDGSIVVPILQIIGIDILLSGDNAVVIALACRKLPENQKKWGIGLGVIAAVGLRVIFAVILQAAMKLPWLSLAGGILLLIIAVQLAIESEYDGKDIAPARSLWGAVWTIAIADLVMSLDNVLAIAGAAKGDPWLILFGLALSVPLIILGATLIMGLLNRYPVFVWAGAALLGWVAGELIGKEPKLQSFLTDLASTLGMQQTHIMPTCEVAGAVFVVIAGLAVLSARKLKAV